MSRRTAVSFRVLLASALAAVAITASITGQQAPSVFTTEQAAAGQQLYQSTCAGCHMPDLAGRNEAPPLAGPNFMSAWRMRTTRDLLEYISTQMPPGGASLSRAQYITIAAYVLAANGATPGTQSLADTTAVLIGAVATGRPQVGGAAAAG